MFFPAKNLTRNWKKLNTSMIRNLTKMDVNIQSLIGIGRGGVLLPSVKCTQKERRLSKDKAMILWISILVANPPNVKTQINNNADRWAVQLLNII